MPFFDWTEEYSVGVRTFDDQHKRLAGYINELHTAMLEGRGTNALTSILDGLIEYTKTHFRDEELPMAEHNFPDFEHHRDEHVHLTNQVIDFQKQFIDGEAILSVPIMQFLKEWLTHHILETDKKYEEFMKQHEVL